MPSISAVTIAKDEAEYLPGCLESVRRVVDEIVVLDTGSSDGTQQLAKEAGAVVHQEPWPDSFAAAKNSVVAKASGEWILVLDADERLHPEDAPALRALLASGDCSAYQLRLHLLAPNGSGQPEASVPATRLFRNRIGCRFEGIVHEQVVLPTGATLDLSDIRLLHLPRRDHGHRLNNAQRNLDLLDRALQNPSNTAEYKAYLRFSLGNEHLWLQRWQPALEAYRLAYVETNLTQSAFAPQLVENIVCALRGLGLIDQARAFAQQHLVIYPDFPDLFYLAGDLSREAGDLDAAKACYQHCIAASRQASRYATVTGIDDFARQALERIQEQTADATPTSS